jgi:protein subunit release factor B
MNTRDPNVPDPPEPADREPPDDATLLAECRVETFRAGGPGGQHQNKTESGVRLTHLPTGITVTARESRSQHRNRQVAMARLREALEERARPETPRIPTEVPVAEKRRRAEQKRRRSRLKQQRQKPKPED